jgi:hypothetical protein
MRSNIRFFDNEKEMHIATALWRLGCATVNPPICCYFIFLPICGAEKSTFCVEN